MTSKRNVIIMIVVLVIVIVGGVIAAVAISSDNSSDVADRLTLAQRYLGEENYERAIIEFDQILDIDPMYTDAYIGKAEALIALDRTDEAIEVLNIGYEITGSEVILTILTELTKPEVTTPTTTPAISVPVSETAVPEPEPQPEITHYPPVETAQMLYDYYVHGAEIKPKMLADVISLEIMHTNYDQPEISISIRCTHSTLPDNKYELKYTADNITNISFAEHMKNITFLSVVSCDISDISPLQNLIQLQQINLCNTMVEDISPLSGMINIHSLDISSSPISDISVLSNLLSLSWLQMNNTKITDLSSLYNLPYLQEINIVDVYGLTEDKITEAKSALNNCRIKTQY